MHLKVIISFLAVLVSLSFLRSQNIPKSVGELVTSHDGDTIRVGRGFEPFVVRLVRDNMVDSASEYYRTAMRLELCALSGPSPFQVIRDSMLGFSSFDFIDVNFDGYLDLELRCDDFRVPLSTLWLFNPRSRLFETSEDFQGLPAVEIDSATKTISTSWWGNTPRCDYESARYVVVNGHLRQISAEKQSYGGSYHEALVNDTLRIVESMDREFVKDSLGRSLTIQVYEELVDDQLVPVRQATLRHIDRTSPEYFEGMDEDCDGPYIVVDERPYPLARKKK